MSKKRGLLSLSSTHLFNIGIGVLTLPIILSSLPISEYGQWQFLLALQSWGLIFSAQQITEGSKRGLALGLDGTFFFAILKRGKLLLITSLLFLVLALYFQNTARENLSTLSLLSSIYIFTNVLIPSSIAEFFIAKKEFITAGIWDAISSPFARIGSCAIAFFSQNIFYFVIFQIVYAAIISLVALCVLTHKRHLWQLYRQKQFDAACLKYGLRFLPIDLLGVLSNRIVEILIGIYFGFSSLALFSVARDLRNQIANAMKIVVPLFYSDFVKQPFEKLIELLRKYLCKMIIASTLLGCSGTALGIIYIIYFLPDAFHVSTSIFLLLSLAFPIGIPTILFATILNTHFRYKAAAAATIIPNLIEIALVALFGWMWGIPGMAIAIAIYGYISFTFFYFATAKRETFKRILECNRVIRAIMQTY